MCSDHLSSSLGTLLPTTPTARTSAGDCRPWSADETTMYGAPVPTWGLQATEDGAGQTLQNTSRPRPVSTGNREPGRVSGPIPGSGDSCGCGPRTIPVVGCWVQRGACEWCGPPGSAFSVDFGFRVEVGLQCLLCSLRQGCCNKKHFFLFKMNIRKF